MPIKPIPVEWLTRPEIDAIGDAISADDLIEGQVAGGKGEGVLLVKVAFNRAAERAGYGEAATTRVKAGDFKYLAERIGEVINVDSPLSPGIEDSQLSAASGG